MSIPAVIAAAAQNYRYNDKFLVDSFSGLSEEEWHRRPSECTNHMAWIVGHLIWARQRLLTRIGTEWSTPWLDVYARGKKLDDSVPCPSPAELTSTWAEVSGVLSSALENVAEEVLSQPVSQGPPSADGKVGGTVNFLAIHETYHVGQAAYLRCWMGHKGVMG